jgi:hypothetical protein
MFQGSRGKNTVGLEIQKKERERKKKLDCYKKIENNLLQ